MRMLVVRSFIHVQAGFSGLRETSVDRSVELANRYANFGVISSFCAGGALLFVMMNLKLDVFGLAGLAEQAAAPPEIVELAERRRRARDARDFDEADRLRAEIEAAGWEARDIADGFQLVPR